MEAVLEQIILMSVYGLIFICLGLMHLWESETDKHNMPTQRLLKRTLSTNKNRHPDVHMAPSTNYKKKHLPHTHTQSVPLLLNLARGLLLGLQPSDVCVCVYQWVSMCTVQS